MPDTKTHHHCGTPWAVSSGPNRSLGPIARSIHGVFYELPADFEYEYCPKCNSRNMTDELVNRFHVLENELRAEHEEKKKQMRRIEGKRGSGKTEGMKEYRKTATAWAEQINEPFVVVTPEGEMAGKPGDVLMCGADGERYVCAKDIFESTYVPV